MGEKMYAFMTNGSYKVNTPNGTVLMPYTVPWNDKTLFKNKAIADVARQVQNGNKLGARMSSMVASTVAPTKFDISNKKAINESIAKTRKQKQQKKSKTIQSAGGIIGNSKKVSTVSNKKKNTKKKTTYKKLTKKAYNPIITSANVKKKKKKSNNSFVSKVVKFFSKKKKK